MKTYKRKSVTINQETNNNLWEAFVNYLDSVYFEGAAELLDKELVSFEYETYKSCYGN